jgi:hypothetical protein
MNETGCSFRMSNANVLVDMEILYKARLPFAITLNRTSYIHRIKIYKLEIYGDTKQYWRKHLTQTFPWCTKPAVFVFKYLKLCHDASYDNCKNIVLRVRIFPQCDETAISSRNYSYDARDNG